MNEFYKTLLNPRGKYGFWGIGLMVLLGVALITVPGLFLQKSKPVLPPAEVSGRPEYSGYSLSQLENSLAQQVSQILSQVQGAGKVVVTVTLEAGPEQQFAQNITDDRSTIEEKDATGGTRTTITVNSRAEVVLAQGRGDPLVAKEIGPKIKGVLVVAEGAGDGEIKSRLGHAVQALLNLPAHRVMVLPKESR